MIGMNRISVLLFLLLSYPNIIYGQFILWEELSVKDKKSYIAKRDSDSFEIAIYEGKRKIHDVPELWDMLDGFVKDIRNERFDPLDFYIFNTVCAEADGAIGEAIGGYCLIYSIECPKQVVSLFKNNSLYLEMYSDLIGFEIAQRSSSMKKIINKIKKKMLKNNTKSDKALVRLFCKKIEDVALTMTE